MPFVWIFKESDEEDEGIYDDSLTEELAGKVVLKGAMAKNFNTFS